MVHLVKAAGGHLVKEAGGHLVKEAPPPPAAVMVTIEGSLTAGIVVLSAGTYQADWRPSTSDYYYVAGSTAIRVYYSAGAWWCYMSAVQNEYQYGHVYWTYSALLGVYGFSSHWGSGYTDAITAVSVA